MDLHPLYYHVAGLAVSLYTAAALLASPRRAAGGLHYLALACLQGTLLFLKEVVSLTGWAPGFATFLVYADFLFGIPALYLFARMAAGEPETRPMRHFLPALLNVPASVGIACSGLDPNGMDGILSAGSGVVPWTGFLWLNAVAAGETFQLVFYARAIRRHLPPAKGGFRRIVAVIVVCYAAYYCVRWIGVGIRLLPLEGGSLAALSPWVNPLCMAFVALTVGVAGIYAVSRSEILRGRGSADGKRKYGGRPLGRSEAEAIVRKVESVLETGRDLSEESVSPRRLASRLGVPYYLLSRAVNEYRGMTVADLIREKRVQRARTLLDAREDASILQIALDSGFSAKSSFNEAFKRTVGMSPTEYRRRRG